MKATFAIILTVILALFWGSVLTSCGNGRPVVYDYNDGKNLDGDGWVYYSDHTVVNFCNNPKHAHYDEWNREYIEHMHKLDSIYGKRF